MAISLKRRNPQAAVLHHFTGHFEGSKSDILLVHRLCRQLGHDTTVPSELSESINLLSELLYTVSRERRVYIGTSLHYVDLLMLLWCDQW